MSSPNIHPTLAKALAERGYATLTPVQLAAGCGAFQRKSPTGGAA